MYKCTKIYFPEQSQQQQKNNSRIKKKNWVEGVTITL